MKTKICSKVLNLVLCFSILLALLPMSMPAAAQEPDNRTRVIVSMGDSYSSGEGIPDFYGQDLSDAAKLNEDDWLGHRSKNSWGSRLTLDGKSMKRNENWYFVASSGAITDDINAPQRVEYNRDGYDKNCRVSPQIDVFDDIGSDKKIEYVTLTIGGNDMGFSEVVREASLGGYWRMPGTLPDLLEKKWDYFYHGGGREKIKQAYWDIYNAAKENNPDVKIIVAGYPNLVNGNGGFQMTKGDVRQIREACNQFNRELEAIVNECKTEGMRICFVSVEDGFAGVEAYADKKETEAIHRIIVGKNEYDLNQEGAGSTFSMHPNDRGAQIYADLVQDKINQIEDDGGRSEWPDMVGSKERDAVLVLDVSGSMYGEPMEETKKASERFVETMMYEEASVGIVVYDDIAMKLSNFNKNVTYLKNVISRLNDGGSTNIESGLRAAEEMFDAESIAKKKFIVLMSDGEPNVGKVGDELVQYANELKEKGLKIYTLGFFEKASNKVAAQALMEKIASEGCHFEVDSAEKLQFFFEDIAEQIRGTKYTYIRIACPVDVSVSYDGETLKSRGATETQRTEFGTLTFEENPNPSENGNDDRIKILRLKEGVRYNVEIEGNGRGSMDYTIGFMDESGEYGDMRRFKNVKITSDTLITTVAANEKTTTLRVDEDGDGKYDVVYKAGRNERAKKVDYAKQILLVCSPIFLLMFIVAAWIITCAILRKVKTRRVV